MHLMETQNTRDFTPSGVVLYLDKDEARRLKDLLVHALPMPQDDEQLPYPYAVKVGRDLAQLLITSRD